MAAEDPLQDGNGSPGREFETALRHERRQEAVQLLAGHEEPLTLIGLANELSVRTDEALPDLLMELHDRHLPELQDSGLVDYDEETGAIRLDQSEDVVEAALTGSREDEP